MSACWTLPEIALRLLGELLIPVAAASNFLKKIAGSTISDSVISVVLLLGSNLFSNRDKNGKGLPAVM